jgi:hypothetical protein
MKTLSVVFLLVAAIGLTLSGCSDKPSPVEGVAVEEMGGGPLGKATVIHTKAVIPLDVVMSEPCIGENIHITGDLFVHTQLVYDENGDLKLNKYHNNKNHVTAVTESGVTYKVIEVVNRSWPVDGGGASSYTFIDNGRLIGPPGEPQPSIKFTLHLTWTPSGELTADVWKISTECK